MAALRQNDEVFGDLRRQAPGAIRRANLLLLRSALALGAALTGLASVVALLGDDPGATNRALRFVDIVGPDGGSSAIRGTLAAAFRYDALAALCLIAAAVGVVWLSAAYLRAFLRAVPATEAAGAPAGRRPGALGALTLLTLGGLFAAVAAALVFSGPTARAAVDALVGGDRALTLWNAGKWPCLVVAYVLLFVSLYRAVVMPPRDHPRPISPRQAVAAALWALVLGGFIFYLANFDSFDQTYGSLGATVVSLMWLTLFSVLYYATPDLQVDDLGAFIPGLAVSLGGFLAISAGFAACAAALDPFGSVYGAVALGIAALAWLWLSNIVTLLGVGLNLVLNRRPPAMDGVRAAGADLELQRLVRAALEDDIAHRGVWSALPGGPRAPGRLTELECDLNDWGFAYGVAWAIAKRLHPAEPDRRIAERALETARAVFGQYTAGEDWPESRRERELAGNILQGASEQVSEGVPEGSIPER